MDQEVLVKGKVQSVRHMGNVTLISVQYQVDAVVFDYVDAEVGTVVELAGEVGEYKGEPQLVVHSIR